MLPDFHSRLALSAIAIHCNWTKSRSSNRVFRHGECCEPAKIPLTPAWVDMRKRHQKTRLTLSSAISGEAIIWIATTCIFLGLYTLRCALEPITVQFHALLTGIVCFALIQALSALDHTSISMCRSTNRCRLKKHKLGGARERSIPLSQIHSALIETSPATAAVKNPRTRVVLITTLGMIPVNDQYRISRSSALTICGDINHFLKSGKDFLIA